MEVKRVSFQYRFLPRLEFRGAAPRRSVQYH